MTFLVLAVTEKHLEGKKHIPVNLRTTGADLWSFLLFFFNSKSMKSMKSWFGNALQQSLGINHVGLSIYKKQRTDPNKSFGDS